MTVSLRALIFDVDGTLADTEEGHRLAFNRAFQDFDFDWTWQPPLYSDLLAITGGRARIRRFVETSHPHMLDHDDLDDLIIKLHERKTEHYVAALNSGGISLRPGVERLLLDGREQGLVLAIATTTTPVNVQALIENTLGSAALDWFDAIGAGDCVEHLKPAPDVYLWVLDKLRLPAASCLALEDSNNGLRAARAAGVGTVVTYCPYTRDHDFDGAIAVADCLGEVDSPARIDAGAPAGKTVIGVDVLRRWHAG